MTAEMVESTGAEAAVAALRALDVRHVFGIVSVHNIPIYDALLRDGSIEAVAVRHEQGAAHAADGYARTSGGLGVALTSTGPGTANAMGGLFEAAFASSRVLLLTGQVESHSYGKGRGALHEAERQVDMLRSVCREVASVRRADDVAPAVLRVAADIRTGRPQPGAVEIPIDLQYAKARYAPPAALDIRPTPPDEKALQQAAALLADARRPLIWAGGGVISAGASAELTDLAERVGAPVLTSVEGRGSIPEDHPLALGPTTDLAAMAGVVGDADVVLAVGARFQEATTGRWRVEIKGQLVHLDVDPGVVGRTYPAAVPVIGDARLGLTGLLELVTGSKADPSYAAGVRDTLAVAVGEVREQIGPDHARIMDTMRALLPRDANVVKDATMPATFWANRLLPVLEPATSVRPASMAIGPGLPLAIGAALGNGHTTALIQGDGGLMLSLGELATAVQYRVPLVLCVFNDGGYGIIRWMQDAIFSGRRTAVDLTTPDFVTLAQSLGMPAERVDGVDKFEMAFERALDADGPFLLDIDMNALQPITVRPQRPR